jgi:ubiquinone/menaquinone biosynthesis C-methylase UbiE
MKLSEEAPRLRLVGVDVSPSMVTKAQQNVSAAGLSNRIEIWESSADHLPFADAYFDVVVSTGSIHHWKEPVTCLNEIHRILKPGGNAWMYDLVSDTPQSVLEEMRRDFGRLKTTLFWLHSFEEPFYTRETFQQLASATRFQQGQTEFVGVLCCLEMQK